MRDCTLRLGLLPLALAALTTACAGTRTETVSAGDVAASVSGARWTAQLNPENQAAVMGNVVLEPTADPRRVQVRISVHGAPVNRTLPWYIQRGTCETGFGLGVLGTTTSYPMLGTSMDGRATLQTVLSVPPPTDIGPYVVKVFAGPGSETVIACGNLERPSN